MFKFGFNPAHSTVHQLVTLLAPISGELRVHCHNAPRERAAFDAFRPRNGKIG
jgi:hypothetical protein